MNQRSLIKKYENKSVPEFINLTMLAIDDNGKMYGCESATGVEMCRVCKIGEYCYMRIFWAFGGGEL